MIPARLRRPLMIAALFGAAVLAIGTALSRYDVPRDESARSPVENVVAGIQPGADRLWGNGLVAAFYVSALGLGGAVFLALTDVTGARWQVGFRWIPRAMTALMPVGGAALLGVLALQLPRFAWQHHGEGDVGPFWFKELWLSTPFFAARAVVIVLLWAVFARWVASSGRKKRGGLSALFLVLFALTLSAAGWDWFMALEPLWFSTIWGVYHFSGLVLATLSTIVILGVSSRRARLRPPSPFTDDHLHDLGQLLFGFSCFWMYIWYSQYMLIWYTNIPEEAFYFARRIEGAWGPVMALNVVLNFGLPFLVLLPRPNKRSASVMTKIAVVVLIGRWLDLSLMVSPTTAGDTPVFGIWEIATIVTAVALTALTLTQPVFQPAPIRESALETRARATEGEPRPNAGAVAADGLPH
ncbi:MAG: hypothetical protein ACE5KM_18195 [Planctomycetaceae bacterium]